MSQASVSGETASDYTYDAFGRRVKTLVGSAETQMLYHGWHMIGAYDETNSKWLWQEVPMARGEGMIEHVALDAADMDEDPNTEYLGYAVHEDWQNTVWALSDASGAITERYVQDDPFGKSHTLDASGNNLGNFASKVYHHKRMHGGVVEEVTGLYDFRNRWYSPESGSWLSRDPLGYVDSENLYQGIGSNTLTGTDVFGLDTVEICGGPATICEHDDGGVYDCWQINHTPGECFKMGLDDPDTIIHCCDGNCKAFRIDPAPFSSDAECYCKNGVPECDGTEEITKCKGQIGSWPLTRGRWSKVMLCNLCSASPDAGRPAICEECCPNGTNAGARASVPGNN